MSKPIIVPIALLLCTFRVFGGVIEQYEDFSSFSARFDVVETYPQDTSNSGTTTDGFNYQLDVGEVQLEFEGPAVYSEDFPEPGVTVLSKVVPWTLTPNAQNVNGGLGFYIYQSPPVDIIIFDGDGDTLVVEGYSNNLGVSGSDFLGFTSSAGIVKIEILPVVAGAITNMAEIALSPNEAPSPEPSPPGATAIPAMSVYGLVLTMLGLFLVAARHLSKRRVNTG